MTEPRALAPHNPRCYVCGPENPCTTHATYTRVGDRVHVALRLDERHEGAPGFVHGGALSAVMDDVLGAVLWVIARPAVTARLEVDYRRPAFIDQDYVGEAWCERIDGRKLHLRGELRNAEGEVVAEGAALFLEVAPEHFAQGGASTLPW